MTTTAPRKTILTPIFLECAGLTALFEIRTYDLRRIQTMKKTVLTFGLIGGVDIAVLTLGTLPFAKKIGFDKSLFVGYTVMVLSFLMVFFGIRSYRDNIGGGTISFGRAFAVGALITLITSVCYVVTWEIMYFKLMPNFINDYSNYLVEKMK